MDFPRLDIDDKYFLREQRYSDAQDFYQYFADPVVSQYILSSIPASFAESQEEIMYWIDLFYKKTGVYWAIATKEHNKMIGAIGFHDWNKYNNRIEISYDLGKEYWNQGIMTKAMEQVNLYAFKMLQVNRIQASTIAANVASIRLLEKSHFIKDGTLRKYRFHQGEYYDIEMFSLLKSDFDANNQDLELNFI